MLATREGNYSISNASHSSIVSFTKVGGPGLFRQLLYEAAPVRQAMVARLFSSRVR